MGSKDILAERYTLADLSITSSANNEWHIDVASTSGQGSDDIKIVFNARKRKWEISSPANSAAVNGHVSNHKKRQDAATEPATIWSDELPDTEHVTIFRQVNWAATPLGPLSEWPVSLQTMVNLLMAESMAAAIYWGPDLSAIYNAEMVNMYQTRLSRYDQCMGQSFKDIWPELWDDFEPMLKDVVEQGIPLDTVDVNLFPVRNGIKEETFWRGSFLPLRDLHGTVRGFLNRGYETTKQIVNERRTKTLNTIALPPSIEGNFVWQHLFNALYENDREFPMAFAYKAIEEVNTGIKLQLQQSIGLPKDGHQLVPQELDLFEGQTGFAPYFRRAKVADRPLLLHRSNDTLPEGLIKGFEWQGFGEPSNSIAIIAINAGDRLLGMMVIGLSPRRPYDVEYEGFLNSLARHTSAIITSATDREEAQLRAARLQRKLKDSEKQIRELAEHGPVGMLQVAPNGTIKWANDQYYELTGHSRKDEDQYRMSFLDGVDPLDHELCASKWSILTEDRQRITVSHRLRRTWKPPMTPGGQENEEEPMWVSTSAFPSIEDGELKYIAAAVTDISHLKWAETLESRNASAAKEAKRLQENFIDIVSHEMRNPLSAITQLADGISSSLDNADDDPDSEKAKSILEDNVENAKTILLCAAHQKRIIDDVLTLSKLDSMMLSITPVAVQPRKVVEAALKMFEGEFQSNDILFHSHIDKSYAENKVDWVTIDPSRLTQIFINLITNAIKFTKLEKKREIKVRSSATFSRPPTVAGVTWFPTNKEYRDLTQSKEWGAGKEIFLCFEVQDTGQGLEQEEMGKLFGRFQQATAKTHIKYGGSGLGLFISRELTETQGGEIGVVSEPGKGSTFAFYIKGRLTDAPEEPAKIAAPVIKPDMKGRGAELDKKVSNQRPQHSTNHVNKTGPSVLLVEDNVLNAKILIRQLERAGCDVYLANHGMEAIDFLSKTRSWKGLASEPDATDVDCILMDVEMPIMDGLTCTRRIRQLESEGSILKHISIVVITANARQEQIDRVMSAGADGVMPKPFKVGDLLTKVEELRKKISKA